jgi:hypothetical protein
MINSDQIVSIWIDHGQIKAKLRDGKDGYPITLGVFHEEESLTNIFSHLYLMLSDGETLGYRVPVRTDVEK